MCHQFPTTCSLHTWFAHKTLKLRLYDRFGSKSSRGVYILNKLQLLHKISFSVCYSLEKARNYVDYKIRK